ncbi:MAG: NADH-ubiquinone oxidoreductase-F iron-sulfur binding region domain-containing protein [Nocardioidaceae bacterium]
MSRRGDLQGVSELCDTLTTTSLCAFGPGVAQAARSIMRVYSDEFEREGSR